MSPDLLFWLPLLVKMGVTAAFVVVATVAAERFGALIGAMIATLPIAAGPAYVFIALDHDDAFIAGSALGGLVSNVATIVFCTLYTMVAQRRGLALSLAAALGAWIALALLSRLIDWTVPSAILLNLVLLALCLPVTRRFRDAPMPPTLRRWYDIPLRAAMVTALVAIVVLLSTPLGPAATGLLASFPIVLTSLMLIFQPRIGGKATATITANAILGLAGYGTTMLVLCLAAVPLGTPTALCLALAVSLSWNLLIVTRRSARR